jgi:hypothetical protein
VKEDKPSKQIPGEAGRVANRLLYGAQRANGPETATVQDRQDSGEVERVVQWTFGTMQ